MGSLTTWLIFQNVHEKMSFSTFWLYKCASRHSGARFLDIWTSKSGPRVWCFAQFDLKMCFLPQRRTILPDRIFQNVHENMSFSTFWLTNALRATAARDFWTSELRKLLRDCGVLGILTWKCASRHSGVPFFICLLNSYPRTRRFSEATFRTSGTMNHWKNTTIRAFPNISRVCIFFLVTLLACWSSF